MSSIQQIKSELDSNNVVLVAVTKSKDVSVIKNAYESGLRVFGESYIQEAEQKIQELGGLEIEWHFIGHLQSNKSKTAVGLFDVIQSVDSLKLAGLIDKEADKIGKVQKIMLQINISGEESKFGIDKQELNQFLEKIKQLKNIKLTGLMAIASNDQEKSRQEFKEMKQLFDLHKDEFGLKFLSMGMTEDYKIAVEEGSNMVRLGRILFGKRD